MMISVDLLVAVTGHGPVPGGRLNRRVTVRRPVGPLSTPRLRSGIATGSSS